jgi:flagellar basal body-associated protein FliL
MRRKKDNKRVLRSGNGRQTTSKRKIRRKKNKFNSPPANPRNRNKRRTRKKRKTSGTIVLIMVIALIAFVIGAGMGVSLSFDDGSTDDDKPQFENVTEEMTSNLNDTPDVSYDKEVDGVDYNENATSQFNIDYPENDND